MSDKTLAERMIEIAQALVQQRVFISAVEVRNCRGSPHKRTFHPVTGISYNPDSGELVIVGRNEDGTQTKSLVVRNPTKFEFRTKTLYPEG